MKYLINISKILIILALLLPFKSLAYPSPEYVTQKTIKDVCGIGEVLGCMTYKPQRILIYWKVRSNPLLSRKIYYHEVGHILTGKWQREDYINKLGFVDTPENNIITLSEKVANMYEDYKTIGLKDKIAVRVFNQLSK